jgi:hypothetical protein
MNLKTQIGGKESQAKQDKEECKNLIEYIDKYGRDKAATDLGLAISDLPDNYDSCIAEKKREFSQQYPGYADDAIDALWEFEEASPILDPDSDLPKDPKKYVLKKCGQPGWSMIQESCWTDTFLYVIFGSDILSEIFVNDLEQLKQTDTELELIVRALSYYLMGMSGETSPYELVKSKYYLVTLIFEYMNKKENDGVLTLEKNELGEDDLRATYALSSIEYGDCFEDVNEGVDDKIKMEKCFWSGNIQFLINFFVTISNNQYVLINYMPLPELENFNNYLKMYNLPLPKIFFITTSMLKNTKRIDTFMTFSKKNYHYDLVGVIKGSNKHYFCYTTCNIPNHYNIAAQHLDKPSYYLDWYLYNDTANELVRSQRVPFDSFKPRQTGLDESDTTREDTVLAVPDGEMYEVIFIYVLRPTPPIKHKFKSRTKSKPKHTSK